MKRWKDYSTATVLALCTLACMAQGQMPEGGRLPLLVVSEPYPPYEYIENGKPVGINVEVVGEAMRSLDIPHTFRVDYPFTRASMMLRNGRADAGLSISHDASRESYLMYTEDQRRFSVDGRMPTNFLWVTEYVFFVSSRYAKAMHFDSYEQVHAAGYRIGALREYVYDPAFRAAGLPLTFYVTPKEALEALDRGEIDLLPLDRTVGTWIAREAGLGDRVTHLPRPLFRKPYLMVFSSQSEYPGLKDVRDRFYGKLRAMHDSGEYRAIFNKHMPPEYPHPLPRPLLFVCENWPPFEFEDRSGVRGINVDVVDRIMRRLNLPYEIRVYPWSRAWMLIENGKADAILSVSYAAAREEFLYYLPDQRECAANGTLPPDHLWISEYVFFVMKRNLDRFRFESYEQIKRDGYRVGVNRDYSYDQDFLNAKLGTRQFSITLDGLTALVQDEIDLYPMDRTVGISELRRMGLEESVAYLPKPILRKAYLAAFSRRSDIPGMEQLMEDFYEELRRLRDTGEYDAIVERAGGTTRTGGTTP